MSDESFISQLEVRRESCYRQAEAILKNARARGSDVMSEHEQKRFDTARSDMLTLDRRIAELDFDTQRAALPPHLQNLGKTTMSNIHVSEPDLYRRGGEYSFGHDLIRASTPGLDLDGSARNRLTRHTEEMSQRRYTGGGMEARDLSRVDGSGGYAVPPAWLMDQYIELARPGRAFANLVQRQPLPGGTDSINIPKLLTGTSVGVQSADNATVTSVDLTDTFINAPVRTIAGEQSLAIQLIDQSPIAFDDVVFRDLVAAHAAVTDQQVLYGSGTNGQMLGVNRTPGIQTVAVSSLDIAGIFKALANAIQLIHTSRFQPPQAIVMHPRRWSWLLSLLDQNNRPLFIPTSGGPFNAAGVLTDVDSQQVVGQTHGLPIVTDPNVTVTDGGSGSGAGGTDDVIYVARTSDMVLFESGIRARVLPEPKASNLTVICQIYSYAAFAASRYPQSVVQLTGLTAPTW
jgi:HK97 family phage major capsid protein